MRVAVIREKKIQNIILADATDSNHCITETDSNGIERNLISIEAEDEYLLKKIKCIFYTIK